MSTPPFNKSGVTTGKRVSVLDTLAPFGLYIVLFGALLVAGGTFLQTRNGSILSRALRQSVEETAAYTKGTGSYFYFDVMSVGGADFALMVVKKIGKNPVYEAHVNIVDWQHAQATKNRSPNQTFSLGTLGSEAVTGAWQLKMQYGERRNLTVFFTSRNAQHRQDVRLVRVNGNVLMATQVVETYDDKKVVYEKVDPVFPRGADGKVDWSE